MIVRGVSNVVTFYSLLWAGGRGKWGGGGGADIEGRNGKRKNGWMREVEIHMGKMIKQQSSGYNNTQLCLYQTLLTQFMQKILVCSHGNKNLPIPSFLDLQNHK